MAAGRGSKTGGSPAPSSRSELDVILSRIVGESRAFLFQVEAYMGELEFLRDERAATVIEAARLALANPPQPGTLRHLERAAHQLLLGLRDVTPPPRPP